MRSRRAVLIALVGLALAAAPAGAQGGGMMGRGMMGRGMMGHGMMGHGDSASAAIMGVVHELMMNHDKLRRTVTNLPDGVRTLTESDDPALAALLRTHVAATGELVAKGSDPNLPMSTSTLRDLLRNGTKVARHVEVTEKGILVTETSTDSATVALLQAHAADVSELVARGMVAMREAMMRERAAVRDTMPARP